MAYQKKYYFSFISIKGRNNIVEIWQDTTDIITAQEITGASNPFRVSLPKLNNIFQPVRGTGCLLNIISETDMEFLNSLYHTTPLEFQVRHYVSGILNWIGFLNSEMYREPFSFNSNYPVALNGNDGMALLDRFKFIQTDLSNYSGLKSLWDILFICLNKIGLPWGNVFYYLSFSFSDFSGSADKTPFHELYEDCSNFYDEDGEAMTLRQVIENILNPFGAILLIKGGDIYITDINTLAKSLPIDFQQFTYDTGIYVAINTISITKTIADIGYGGTGQSIEISGGVNKQVVSYSPYPIVQVVEKSITSETEFETIPTTWATKDGYQYKILANNKTWQEISPAFFEESYYGDSEKKIYLNWTPPVTNQKIMSLKVLPFLSLAQKGTTLIDSVYESLAIKFEINVLIKTKTNPYDSTLASYDFQGLD
ncbi:MAG: hypothetical protein GWP06_02200, partial [Actinobacteria bacterium]|nr:hypothetical protein [Actinomycetota bacterium]